jgi:hypothetical protein
VQERAARVSGMVPKWCPTWDTSFLSSDLFRFVRDCFVTGQK